MAAGGAVAEGEVEGEGGGGDLEGAGGEGAGAGEGDGEERHREMEGVSVGGVVLCVYVAECGGTGESLREELHGWRGWVYL